MSTLVTPQRNAHWYRWKRNAKAIMEGDPESLASLGYFEPCHTLPKKDGSGMKNVTLREARELGLLWSVTRVCNTVAKPGLEAWKQEQAIMAALTLPRLPDEPLDAFARRVIADMDAQSDKAREFGSLLHRQIEQDLRGELDVPDWTCENHLAAVHAWLKDWCLDFHATEIIVGDPALGVAGKLDLDCTLKDFGRSIIDFKTQKVRNNKPNFYLEWGLQLAAYRHCIQLEDGISRRIVSVIIDTGDEPRIFAHWWPDDIDYLGLFKGLLEYLCIQEGYDPRKP